MSYSMFNVNSSNMTASHPEGTCNVVLDWLKTTGLKPGPLHGLSADF